MDGNAEVITFLQNTFILRRPEEGDFAEKKSKQLDIMY